MPEFASGVPSTQTTGSGDEIPRRLNLLDATMINVGTMIGSGVFLVPATIALYVQSELLAIWVWVIGGIVSLFGAVSVAELGSLLPRSGGQYVYLKEAYGPLWGFLYGWAGFGVIISASISAIAVGFATYLAYLLPMSAAEIRFVAILSIVFLTGMNCLGVKLGAQIQNGFTFLKIGALLGLVAICFVAAPSGADGIPISPIGLIHKVGPFGLALIAALWAYDGWIEITYVAGEVQQPHRNIPLSLIMSTALVTGIYVLLTIAIQRVLPMNAIAQSPFVAADAAESSLGALGGTFVTLAVVVSTFGANNGIILTGARIYQVMAREGLFFHPLSYIHPKYQTPIPSLIAQGIWASLLVLSGTYDQLITYVVFVSWIFYAMSGVAVIVLRKKSINSRPKYRTWGYPYTTMVFVGFSIALVVNTIVEAPFDSLIGFGIMFLGVPAFFYWQRHLK